MCNNPQLMKAMCCNTNV